MLHLKAVRTALLPYPYYLSVSSFTVWLPFVFMPWTHLIISLFPLLVLFPSLLYRWSPICLYHLQCMFLPPPHSFAQELDRERCGPKTRCTSII